MVSRRFDTESKATRDRLVVEAMRLFAERGFRATTVGDIEAAAGLVPRSGGLYKHFAPKRLHVSPLERSSRTAARSGRSAPIRSASTKNALSGRSSIRLHCSPDHKEGVMSERRWWVRAALAVLGFQLVVTGLWAVVDPLGWYKGFPGLGRHWVVATGPYDRPPPVDPGRGSSRTASAISGP